MKLYFFWENVCFYTRAFQRYIIYICTIQNVVTLSLTNNKTLYILTDECRLVLIPVTKTETHSVVK